MFKKITALLASAMMIFGLTGCALTKQDLIETEYNMQVPPKMVFLGDSIAAGYALEGYTDTDNYHCDSYSNILAERYTTELADICIAEMYNLAVSGDTSDDLLEILDSGEADEVLADADAVVISIGGNDMLHILFGLLQDLGLSAENKTINLDDINLLSALAQLIDLGEDVDKALDGFEKNIRKISDTLHEKTNGEIYVQTLYNPFESFMNIQMLIDFSTEKIGRFNDIIRNNASDYTVIEVAEKFDGRGEELTRINSLDIHPNEEGHKVIADIVDDSFRATGFTYIKQEYSDPHLTLSAILLIMGGILAVIAVILIIPKLFGRNKNDNDKKKISD